MRIKSFLITLFIFAALMFARCGGDRIPAFNQDRAYDYLVKQCDFGARVPNSQAHAECEEYLFNELSSKASVCRRQQFTYADPLRGDTLHLTNLIASFNPGSADRALLCAHWDCRPWADNDPDSSLHDQPVMGADDGASGVAILLELANIFQANPLPFGLDIIFFDGEDYGQDGSEEGWLLGSKYFTENLGRYRPQYVILLDMVGDSALNIHKEYHSQTYAGPLVSRIWKAASLEKAEHFHPDIVHAVYDDHVPFLLLGIPAADIIDMDYQWWHTVSDTPDKCSANSLGEVGRVILRLLYDRNLQ